MVAKDGDVQVRLTNENKPSICVPGEIFSVYQPIIGYQATSLWINLRFHAISKSETPFSYDNMAQAGMSQEDISNALQRLSDYGLITKGEDGRVVVHVPLNEELFHGLFGKKGERLTIQPVTGDPGGADEGKDRTVSSLRVVTGAGEETKGRSAGQNVSKKESKSPSVEQDRSAGGALKLVEAGQASPDDLDPDMQAVVQIYQKRIGMIGPTQYDKLRFWIEEQKMEGAVVALAIEETVRSADVPRISYLEGILRNWFNEGIRTFDDLQRREKASKVLSDSRGFSGRASKEGTANAAAYESVSADQVAKWKELYPDEYDD